MDKPVSEMTPNEWVRHNQEQRILDNMERSQNAVAMPQPQAAAQPRQQYFTPGGFRDAREGVIAGIFAPVMIALYRAATRELVDRGEPQQGSTYAKAIGHALSVVWQWKTWSFTVLYWVLSGLSIYFWMGAEEMQGIDTGFHTRLLVLHAAMLVVAIGVPYCQAVDASYFKQRALYRLLHPVQRAIGWLPWFVLQSLVLLPLLFIIQYRW